MDATPAQEARLAQMAEAGCRGACERLAAGECVDEGEVTGIAKVETSRDAALWLMLNPPPSVPEPYASQMRALATHKSANVRRAAADSFSAVRPIPGIVEVCPTDDLSTEEFMRLFRTGRAELMRAGLAENDAATEWIWQYAEEQTGIKRNAPEWAGASSAQSRRLSNAKNAAYQRVYRNS